MTRPWTRWQDWVNLVAGIVLFIAPWYSVTWGHIASSWDAWILGIAIVLVALWALATASSTAPEAINIILGAWVFISPWVLGFASLAAIAWSFWIIGAIVVILSAWAAAQLRNPNVRVPA
jgi:hypothetical protein